MVNIIQLQNKILPSQTPTQRDVDDKTKYSPHKLLHRDVDDKTKYSPHKLLHKEMLMTKQNTPLTNSYTKRC